MLLIKDFLTWPMLNCNIYSIISHRVASGQLFPPGVRTKGKAEKHLSSHSFQNSHDNEEWSVDVTIFASKTLKVSQ